MPTAAPQPFPWIARFHPGAVNQVSMGAFGRPFSSPAIPPGERKFSLNALDRRSNAAGQDTPARLAPQHLENQGFQQAMECFVRACPGPLLAEHGLRITAYQRIPGIQELEDGIAAQHRIDALEGPCVSSVMAAAGRLGVRPDYLSQAAQRRGYSYSKALRWIRFFHGVALRAAGVSALHAAWQIGFSDPSGWTRFVQALVGKAPSQLPNVPLGFWIRRAVEDVYMGAEVHDPPLGEGRK